MSRQFIDRTLWPVVMTTIAALVILEATGLDLRIQDALFDFDTGRWFVDRHEPIPRLLFYDAPKMVLICLGIGLLARSFMPGLADLRRDAFVAFLTLASVPALIGLGKSYSNVFSPWDLERYGGPESYVRLWESNTPGAPRGHSFPAGHASGGFSLVGLAGLARRREGRIGGIALGLATGSAMGLYQTVNGAHFLSHTVVTAGVAWSCFLFWRRILGAAVVKYCCLRPEGGLS